MNPADTTLNPPAPQQSRSTWLDLADHALHDPRVRRDILIALAMMLLTIIASAWFLAGTSALLALTAAAAGTRLIRRRQRARSGNTNKKEAEEDQAGSHNPLLGKAHWTTY